MTTMIVVAAYAQIANSDDYLDNRYKSKQGKTIKTIRTMQDSSKVDDPVDHLFDDDHNVEDGRASGDESDGKDGLDDDDWHNIEEELCDSDSFNRQVAFEVCTSIYRLQY